MKNTGISIGTLALLWGIVMQILRTLGIDPIAGWHWFAVWGPFIVIVAIPIAFVLFGLVILLIIKR